MNRVYILYMIHSVFVQTHCKYCNSWLNLTVYRNKWWSFSEKCENEVIKHHDKILSFFLKKSKQLSRTVNEVNEKKITEKPSRFYSEKNNNNNCAQLSSRKKNSYKKTQTKYF